MKKIIKTNTFQNCIYYVLCCILMVFGFVSCGSSPDNAKLQDTSLQLADIKDESAESKEEAIAYSNYDVEKMEGLFLGDEFKLDHYYISNHISNTNHYYIDNTNVLWGYGRNDYGQLGNGLQYIPQNGYENSWEDEPQKIAENVIHVDSGDYFVIYLTKSGDLYGIGANLNGIMGMDVSEKYDYVSIPTMTVAVEPVLLMSDVTYARCGMRGIAALKADGSVWWWGEIRTTSSKTGDNTVGLSYSQPEKMIDNVIYVTCGNFSIGAIKEDGSLWTWGNNTFGSCGLDSGHKDFIDEPVMAAEDVKMVWFDEVKFDSSISEMNEFGENVYACQYYYVTFIEKTDGTLAVCGYEVDGRTKNRTYPLLGDAVENEEQVSYSDTFQPLSLSEKEREPHLKFAACEYGWSPEEVSLYLDKIRIVYKWEESTEGDKTQLNITVADPSFILSFNEDRELAIFHYLAYGSRDGRLTIGMERKEVEAIFGAPPEEEITFPDNDTYLTVVYVENNIYYNINYYNGKVKGISESNTAYVRKED